MPGCCEAGTRFGVCVAGAESGAGGGRAEGRAGPFRVRFHKLSMEKDHLFSFFKFPIDRGLIFLSDLQSSHVLGRCVRVKRPPKFPITHTQFLHLCLGPAPVCRQVEQLQTTGFVQGKTQPDLHL